MGELSWLADGEWRMSMHPAQVCVVGNAAIDLTLRVAQLPLAGETALAVETMQDFGGKGANQAVMARGGGARGKAFAALGSDAEGERILARLIEEGIDTRHVMRLPCATDLSIVTVDQRGENTIVTRNEAASRYEPSPDELLDASSSGDWVVLQGNLGEAVTARMLHRAHAGERRTLLNPGPVSFDCRPLLNDVDILVVNRVEATALTRHEDPSEAALALLESGTREVLVTLGAEGVLWVNAEHAELLSATSVDAVDTVGAGDAFCGMFVAALAQGDSMRAALNQAQMAAAFTVARRGAQAAFPSRADLLALFPSST
jgi:ribokinase